MECHGILNLDSRPGKFMEFTCRKMCLGHGKAMEF